MSTTPVGAIAVHGRQRPLGHHRLRPVLHLDRPVLHGQLQSARRAAAGHRVHRRMDHFLHGHRLPTSSIRSALRASKIEEIEGLDKHEHGLPSAYADFTPRTARGGDHRGGGPARRPRHGRARRRDGHRHVRPRPCPPVSASEEAVKLSKVVIVTKQSKV